MQHSTLIPRCKGAYTVTR